MEVVSSSTFAPLRSTDNMYNNRVDRSSIVRLLAVRLSLSKGRAGNDQFNNRFDMSSNQANNGSLFGSSSDNHSSSSNSSSSNNNSGNMRSNTTSSARWMVIST